MARHRSRSARVGCPPSAARTGCRARAPSWSARQLLFELHGLLLVDAPVDGFLPISLYNADGYYTFKLSSIACSIIDSPLSTSASAMVSGGARRKTSPSPGN